LLWLFWTWVLRNYLLGLALNGKPLDLIPSSQDYRREPLVSDTSLLFLFHFGFLCWGLSPGPHMLGPCSTTELHVWPSEPLLGRLVHWHLRWLWVGKDLLFPLPCFCFAVFKISLFLSCYVLSYDYFFWWFGLIPFSLVCLL
jgi:hypothetical protein